MIKFLQLKHWQLFALLFGTVFILQIFTFAAAALTHEPKILIYFFPIIMIVYFALFISWFYSMGTNFHRKLPASVNMNLKKFKVFLAIPMIYIVLLSIFQIGVFSEISRNNPPNPAYFLFIIPVHLFSIFCIFYCMYFIAKEFKSVEVQKSVYFSDFAGEFFLLWFFPIGIWFIQPRINKIFEAEK